MHKRLRKYLGSIYKRIDALFPYPFRVYKRKGCLFLLNRSSMMDEGLIKFKEYEEDMIRFAQDTIVEKGITHFFDLGANLGYYTVRLGRLEQLASVVSFEPLPQLYLQVGSNVLINGLADKWQGHCCALSDRATRTKLHYHPFYLGTSSLDSEWTDRADHSVDVDVSVFDELVGVSGERCFVKIDVEGSEVGVIAGMQRFLSGNKVFLQVEAIEKNYRLIHEQLQALGYRQVGKPFDNDYYLSNF